MSLARWPVPQSRTRPIPPSHVVTPPTATAAPSQPDWYWPVITPRRPVALRVRRTSFSEPPWPSITPDAFPPGIIRPRTKPALQRRARLAEPPWIIAIPQLPPQTLRPRVKPQLQRRGRRFEPPWPSLTPPAFPPESPRPRVKPQYRRRGQRFEPPWALPLQGTVPQYLRPRVRPALQRRTRFSEVVPDQVTVSVFPPTLVRARVKPALQRRAHLFEPPWPQGAQPGAPTLIERSKMGVGI